MTISLKHAFTSAVADSDDTSLVRPSNWNAEHVLTQATSRILGRVTVGAGATEELTAAQVKSLLAILAADISDFSTAADLRIAAAVGVTVQAFDADLSAIAALAPSNDDIIQRKAGAWTNRTMAQLLADLSAVGTTFQPLDADLTSWAGVTRASGFDTFAATPSSANLRSLVTDETGGGALVFATTPTVDNTVPRFDGTSGSIQTSTVVIDDDGKVGIGASVIDQFLTITGSVSGVGGVNCWIRNNDAGGLASLATLSASSNNFNQFISFGLTSGLTRFGSVSSNGLNEFSSKGPLIIGSTNDGITWATNNTVKGKFHSSGGFSWGDTTDPGAGNVRITGSYSVAGVPVPERIFASVQGTNVALTNNITTAQNIFAAANDTLTVAASTTYRFRAVIQLNTGATSHTTSFGFGGTATITSCHYRASSTSSAADTLATPQARRVSVATAAVLTAASTAVTTDIEIEGIIRINGAGTLIPQVTFSAGPTGTCEVVVDSFIEFLNIGSNTVAAAGAWA